MKAQPKKIFFFFLIKQGVKISLYKYLNVKQHNVLVHSKCQLKLLYQFLSVSSYIMIWRAEKKKSPWEII